MSKLTETFITGTLEKPEEATDLAHLQFSQCESGWKGIKFDPSLRVINQVDQFYTSLNISVNYTSETLAHRKFYSSS